MNQVGEIERAAQRRVIELLKSKLGYAYLGNWEERAGNSNIEEPVLRRFLASRGYSDRLIERAVFQLRVAANDLTDGLYAANKRVYGLLRYGVQVKAAVGDNFETVQLVDWKKPESNEFSIAEEVTIAGQHDKRPDIVLYVNGIALGVIELKRSTVSVGDGIRQNITNQRKEFIQSFFSTVQWIFAGNDTEGLRYGAIGTPEKYYLKWKEDSTEPGLLDKYLLKLCEKERFLEIIYDFMLFDAGIKKICRPHQYTAVKAAQEHAKRREGGIIWHTQGSGKSLVMVWLARWILENNPNARVAIVTDRDELDKQIEGVFEGIGEQIERTSSGRNLMEMLGNTKPRLMCSLVHKFGRGSESIDKFIEEMKSTPAKTVGELFIFVDECHRTQTGKLHRAMKATLRNAIFVGFTGTPLLRRDKKTSVEVFGKYIHTYKFQEGVEDEVILDLSYDARDVDQRISSQKKIDEWFESKTRGLNDYQKSELKRRWGTLQKVLGSRSRLERIVADIVHDFGIKPRLDSGRGNAILVASSIYEACRYFELFQQTELKGRCGIVTSYNPATKDITTEDTGANTETERESIYRTYEKLLGSDSTEQYEEKTKKKFIKEPANMKLLVVVDKLLVGFDAPPCTYLYIDKSMQDHGLFQAICRVNRLDSEDKERGFIVDYKDLFRKVEKAMAVYTSELDYDEFDKTDVDILIKDRLDDGKQRLDEAFEEIELLCEPVKPPRNQIEYQRYFCGNPENPDDLKANESKRAALYKATASLLRAYADISAELEEAGYSAAEAISIEGKVRFYVDLRQEIKMASGEHLDVKTYEADMRRLIDTYIQAEDPRTVSEFEGMTLLEIIAASGADKAIERLPGRIRTDREAVAEAIENNIRRKIAEESLVDPVYFGKMSALLEEIIRERRASAANYAAYLAKIADLAKKVTEAEAGDLPPSIKTRALRALYHNLSENDQLAVEIDETVRRVKRADWRGNPAKERGIKAALFEILQDIDEVERVFAVIKQQSEY